MNVFVRHWRMGVFLGGSVAVILLLRLPSMQNAVTLATGIAWPVTILTIVWWFRRELTDLLGRMKKIGREGAEFDGPQRLPMGGDPASPTPVLLAAPAGGHSAPSGEKPQADALIAPAFRLLYSQFVTRTKERLAALRNIVAGSDADLAIAISAEFASALQLERASRVIFKSQVDALDELKWRRTTKSAFQPYYDRAVQVNPPFFANYTFDQWFNYLVQFGLVEGTDDAISVTPAGEALRMYIAQQGYASIAA